MYVYYPPRDCYNPRDYKTKFELLFWNSIHKSLSLSLSLYDVCVECFQIFVVWRCGVYTIHLYAIHLYIYTSIHLYIYTSIHLYNLYIYKVHFIYVYMHSCSKSAASGQRERTRIGVSSTSISWRSEQLEPHLVRVRRNAFNT
jgi:hypothetical protein